MPIYRAVVHIDSPDMGGHGVNVWHVRTTGAFDPDHVDANNAVGLLNDVYTAWMPLFKGSTGFSFDGLLTEIESEDPELITDLDTWTTSGGTSTDNLPPANAMVIGWRTASAGRSGRGRTFLGPLSRDCLEGDGTPSGDALDVCADGVTTLVEGQDGFDFGAWGIYSPKDHVCRDIVGASIKDRFAVLRSRRD